RRVPDYTRRGKVLRFDHHDYDRPRHSLSDSDPRISARTDRAGNSEDNVEGMASRRGDYRHHRCGSDADDRRLQYDRLRRADARTLLHQHRHCLDIRKATPHGRRGHRARHDEIKRAGSGVERSYFFFPLPTLYLFSATHFDGFEKLHLPSDVGTYLVIRSVGTS